MQLKAQIKENQVNLMKVATESNCVGGFLQLMEAYCYTEKEVSMEQYFMLTTQPASVMEAAMEGNRSYEICETKFRNTLEHEKDSFQNTIVEIQKKFARIKQYNSYAVPNDSKEKYTEVATFGDTIQQALEKVKSFNVREALFGDEISMWDDLESVSREFEPYHKLWDTIFNFTNNQDEWTS